MAFSGYLIKVGGVEIPFKYIRAESYKCTPQQRIELTATRDNSGVLHRETVSNKPVKIEFETPYLTDRELQALNSIIKTAFTNTNERKLSVEYFDHFDGTYKTESCYMPDIDYTIYRMDVEKNEITYEPIRLAFIGY